MYLYKYKYSNKATTKALVEQFTSGFCILYSAASLLCSLKNSVCSAMRPGWTLARMSPARYNSSIGRCMGFSFPKKAVFF